MMGGRIISRVSLLVILYLYLVAGINLVCLGQKVESSDTTFTSHFVIDSLSRPSVYYPMLQTFEYHKLTEDDVVFLGNSITFWADWPSLLNNGRAKNRGIPGDNTFGVRERLFEVTQSKPHKIFILIGINDVAANIPDNVILRNCRGIIRQIKAESPSSIIYIQTLLPTNDDFGKAPNHYGKDKHIRYINSRLKVIGDEEGVSVIDLYAHFVDEKGKLKHEYTWDGLHLTIDGYLHWVRLLKEGAYLDGL